ncbi:flagellar biosynthesis anti-sigma factor FlgM [Shewanella sp. 202IG2-18]|uniref:flagellar biosynthesis anti-sigma factor FlgM n=1 Tax=Parashewanella hymeniacidonis TaxID=2807618 RepID=UPI0019621BEF|nr:flagellar biosynthesis anti-sigma factor FlgM [Parashewanella hymeniacidonis]
MEISKFNQSTVINSAKSAATKNASPATEKSVITSESDPAKISRDFEVLSQAQQQLSSIAEVNLEKVAAVQQSIKDRSFSIDLEKIAESMSKQHGSK